MAISGQQIIEIGLPNESANSDSLYTAFNKTKNNFANLFACASPYTTFAAGNGVSIATSPSTGTVTINNTGVLDIVPGTGVSITSEDGVYTISSNGGGGGNSSGTVTSIGVSSTTLSVSGSPVVSSGNITVNLPTVANVAGSYTYPSVSVDGYGRITSISNGASVGTVTSVGITPGAGIQVTGSPVTTNGTMTVVNTGVTRLNAGTGISLSGSNGNVTVSTTTSGGTVTSVALSSSTLNITNSPIITAGTINVELPSSISVTNVTANGIAILSGSENLGNGNAASLSATASYFTTTGASTATLAAGTEGQIKTFMMVADGGDMVITVTNAGWKSSGTGTITFNDIGDGCTLQYINSKWFCVGQNGVSFA